MSTTELTTLSDVFDPDVWADSLQADFTGRTRIADWALQDDSLVGEPGMTVHFPKWDAMSDLDEVAETEDLNIDKLSQTDSTAVVKEYGKAVAVTNRARLGGVDDPLEEARRQLGILFARRVDKDLLAAAKAETEADSGKKIREAKPHILDVTTTSAGLDWNILVDAAALFGDTRRTDGALGLFIHSKQQAALMKRDEFIRLADMGKDLITHGTVGMIAGMPVVVSDLIEPTEAYLMERNALGVKYKQRPTIETDKDIVARKFVIAATTHYAVKRLKDNGVARIKLKTD